MDNCNNHYDSLESCLKICVAFPVGDVTDSMVNTVGCRFNMSMAAVDNSSLCDYAGPSGGGVCGSLCEAHCNMTTNCSAADFPTCMAVCSLYNATIPMGDTESNSFACRFKFAMDAVLSDNAEDMYLYCGRSSPNGGDTCGDTCDNYCAYSAQFCPGTFEDNSVCLNYCYQVPEGAWNDTAANTRGCRMYHTVAAYLTQLPIHCKHAAPSGENYCGSWCEVYCQLALSNCVNANQLFENETQCMTACALFNDKGRATDASGDSVQCRIYHLGVAGTSVNNANEHCPHANVTSAGGICSGEVTTAPPTPTSGAATSGTATSGSATSGSATSGASTNSTNTSATSGGATSGSTSGSATTASTTANSTTTGNAFALCVYVILMLVVLF
jgi:hypothetical protein